MNRQVCISILHNILNVIRYAKECGADGIDGDEEAISYAINVIVKEVKAYTPTKNEGKACPYA